MATSSTAGTATGKESTGKGSRVPRSANWEKAEVKALIALWSEDEVQRALDDPLTRNSKIYQRQQPSDRPGPENMFLLRRDEPRLGFSTGSLTTQRARPLCKLAEVIRDLSHDTRIDKTAVLYFITVSELS